MNSFWDQKLQTIEFPYYQGNYCSPFPFLRTVDSRSPVTTSVPKLEASQLLTIRSANMGKILPCSNVYCTVRGDVHFFVPWISPCVNCLLIVFAYFFLLDFLSFSLWFTRISPYLFNIDFLSGINFFYSDLYWIEILNFDLARPIHFPSCGYAFLDLFKTFSPPQNIQIFVFSSICLYCIFHNKVFNPFWIHLCLCCEICRCLYQISFPYAWICSSALGSVLLLCPYSLTHLSSYYCSITICLSNPWQGRFLLFECSKLT